MPANIRDRIKELRRVPAKDLISNPKNWRRHGTAQKKAMRTMLENIGFANALLARETDRGELMLIDGHLRAGVSPDEVVPVLVLDVNEQEADQLLATLDPIAGMAEVDTLKLSSLVEDIKLPSVELDYELRSLLAVEDSWRGGDLGAPPDSVQENKMDLEQMRSYRKKARERVSDKTDTEHYVVLVFPNRAARESLMAKLGLPVDERYLPGLDYEVRPRKGAQPTNGPQAAPKQHSGATG